jgi:hypothetical protein
MRTLLAIVLALGFAGVASAQLYKWIDKNGHIQYGDTPPTDAQKVTRLKAPPPGSAPAPAAPATPDAKKEKPLTPEQAFQKRQQERAEAEQKAEKERAEADQKRANCDLAQANLRQFQTGQRIASVNAAGERVYLDDDQRAQQQARAEQAVAQWCK